LLFPSLKTTLQWRLHQESVQFFGSPFSS